MTNRDVSPSDKKELSISMKVVVDENVTQEEIAEKIEEVLQTQTIDVDNISNLAIRSVPRLVPPGGGNGYETRIWEKVTCNARFDDPTTRLINPEDEFDQILERARIEGLQVGPLGRFEIFLMRNIRRFTNR